MLRKRIIFFAIALCAVVTLFNVTTFAAAFPGVSDSALVSGVKAGTLPRQRDYYRPPLPPLLLSRLTARRAYVSLEKPVQLPLVRYHADDVAPLASLTKLMSALVALSLHPDWSKTVTIEDADRRSGAQQRVYPGEVVSMQDLWTLMLVGSDNDAVVAFIRGLGISEQSFVEKMNAEAKSLNLTKTTFVEPTGLSSGNLSTAREYAVVARRAFAESRIAEPLAEAEAFILVSGKQRKVYNTDQELKGALPMPHIWQFISGKTGFIDESGYNVAVLGGDVVGNQMLTVVLGSASVLNRAEDASALLEWATETAQKMPAGEIDGNRLLY
ncbi:MAG: serine hydrolase [Patescibacteria group bacterium]|jgi:D-alanyl-D-alanine endopeptidase (penicillin-binding protein 7)